MSTSFTLRIETPGKPKVALVLDDLEQVMHELHLQFDNSPEGELRRITIERSRPYDKEL